MPYVSQSVDLINSRLAAVSFNDTRFNVGLYGLSNLLPRIDSGSNDTIPSVISQDGSIEFSGFDDKYSLVIYHRCLSTRPVEHPYQFGDSLLLGREECKMKMVVFANRTIIKENEQELAFRITRGLTNQFIRNDISSLSGVMGITAEAGRSNFDSVAVFTQEYKLPAKDYPIAPEQIYFAMEYDLTIDYDVNCISSCSTC